jgi:hypothetical protein
MADSDAVRARRYRQHRQGDHSLCKHWPGAGLTRLPDVHNINVTGFDPADEMRKLAGRLSAAYKADPPNAALARELRMTLLALGPEAEAMDPGLAEMFAAFRT